MCASLKGAKVFSKTFCAHRWHIVLILQLEFWAPRGAAACACLRLEICGGRRVLLFRVALWPCCVARAARFRCCFLRSKTGRALCPRCPSLSARASAARCAPCARLGRPLPWASVAFSPSCACPAASASARLCVSVSAVRVVLFRLARPPLAVAFCFLRRVCRCPSCLLLRFLRPRPPALRFCVCSCAPLLCPFARLLPSLGLCFVFVFFPSCPPSCFCVCVSSCSSPSLLPPSLFLSGSCPPLSFAFAFCVVLWPAGCGAGLAVWGPGFGFSGSKGLARAGRSPLLFPC